MKTKLNEIIEDIKVYSKIDGNMGIEIKYNLNSIPGVFDRLYIAEEIEKILKKELKLNDNNSLK